MLEIGYFGCAVTLSRLVQPLADTLDRLKGCGAIQHLPVNSLYHAVSLLA